MTKNGEANRFGRFIFADEQAERVHAGDMSAVWEFIEDNFKYLMCWAKKYIRNELSFMPEDMYGSFYQPEELINQIFVDFPFYKLDSEKSLGISIFCSFKGISCGGYKRSWHAQRQEVSLEQPYGEEKDGDTLKDLLPSRELIPSEELIRHEHVKEIAPHYFQEIGKLFRSDGNGATVGELLAYNQSKQASAFQDVIEEVFFGYTYEEIEAYAKRTA